MSRAYCLTCNEQVMMTASGTCPDGHPVATRDGGPEPWVARASAEDETTGAVAEADAAELKELHHVGAGTVNGNGHAGAVHGRAANGQPANGQPSGAVALHDHVDEAPPAAVTRHPANSQVSDDLAAMLAEALNSDAPADRQEVSEPDAPGDGAPPAEPVEPAAVDTSSPAQEEDWADLATLAAELQLDGSSSEAPHDPQPTAEPAPPPPPASEPGAGWDPWTLPEEPTADVATPTGEDLPSSPAADAAVEDVPADAPAPEPVDPTTSSLDLTNFTARGARVGTGGKPARRLFGRKR